MKSISTSILIVNIISIRINNIISISINRAMRYKTLAQGISTASISRILRAATGTLPWSSKSPLGDVVAVPVVAVEVAGAGGGSEVVVRKR